MVPSKDCVRRTGVLGGALSALQVSRRGELGVLCKGFMASGEIMDDGYCTLYFVRLLPNLMQKFVLLGHYYDYYR